MIYKLWCFVLSSKYRFGFSCDLLKKFMVRPGRPDATQRKFNSYSEAWYIKNYSSNKSPENISAAAWSESNDIPQQNLHSYTNSFSSSHPKEMSYLTKEENKSRSRIGRSGVEGKNAEDEEIIDIPLETKSTRSPSNIPKHFDNVSKKDNVHSIKNDNNQKNLRKKDKTDDSEKGKD